MGYGTVAGIDKPVSRIVFGTDRLRGRRLPWLPDRSLELQAFSLLDRSFELGWQLIRHGASTGTANGRWGRGAAYTPTKYGTINRSARTQRSARPTCSLSVLKKSYVPSPQRDDPLLDHFRARAVLTPMHAESAHTEGRSRLPGCATTKLGNWLCTNDIRISSSSSTQPRGVSGLNCRRQSKLTSLGSLVVGRGGWDAAEVSVFDAVAVSFERHDVGVVRESVDHGGGDDVIANASPQQPKGLLLVTMMLARS